MRALTVRQPWAWAIVYGGKDVENRTRSIAGSYRGPVAIHAGLRIDPLGGARILEASGRWSGRPQDYPDGQHPWIRGAIIGVVDLVDVHAGWIEPTPCTQWGQRYDGRSGLHHLVLTNPRPLTTPIPRRGRLGLWTLPDEIAAAVTAQLGGVA